MYRKVLLSSFHNGKVEYCTTSGSGDIEENASAIFFTQTLFRLLDNSGFATTYVVVSVRQHITY